MAFAQNISAQIDTTDWYPLHIGDKWEYYSRYFGSNYVEVIGDTLMPNGKTYFILDNANLKYQRVDSSRYVMVYNEYAENDEFINFDLHANKGDVLFDLEESNHGYGVYETGRDYDNLINLNLAWKEYREADLDTSVTPPDTIWCKTVDAYWPKITKGIGVTTYTNGLEILVGVVINGVGYGTLVGVDGNTDIVTEFQLYQNYPNPFNPTTIIKYSIPQESHITIYVYNMLGEKVKTLCNGVRKKGEYKVQFDGSNLSSGIYLIYLVTTNYNQVIKALLIK